jgi:hypothetical protein
MDIPKPSECLGVVAIPLSILGMLAGVYFVLFETVYPWGWVLFVASFVLWMVAAVYCIDWEWEALDRFGPDRE